MALVAYDNSDSSEYEDEDDDNSSVAILNEHIETKDGKHHNNIHFLLFTIKIDKFSIANVQNT